MGSVSNTIPSIFWDHTYQKLLRFCLVLAWLSYKYYRNYGHPLPSLFVYLIKHTLRLQRFKPAAVPSPLSVDASPVLLDVEVVTLSPPWELNWCRWIATFHNVVILPSCSVKWERTPFDQHLNNRGVTTLRQATIQSSFWLSRTDVERRNHRWRKYRSKIRSKALKPGNVEGVVNLRAIRQL